MSASLRLGDSWQPAVSIVGRHREQALLRERLRSARSGDGSFVLVGGEAGIGKTTLIESLAREASQERALVLIGKCHDLVTTPPYGPWIEILRACQPITGVDVLGTLDLPAGDAQRDVASQGTLFG